MLGVKKRIANVTLGRWPETWEIPKASEIVSIMEGVTLLIRLGDKSLHEICPDGIRPFVTNITNEADVTCLEEVKGLRVRFAYPAIVPVGDRYAGDVRVTVEDIFANISSKDLTPGTFIEVQTRFASVKFDERVNNSKVWQIIIILYDKEVQ